MTTSFSLVMDSREARRLHTFMADRERARRRIDMLERDADVFTQQGKAVPAAAQLRTARLIKYLWCLDDGTGSNGEL